MSDRFNQNEKLFKELEQMNSFELSDRKVRSNYPPVDILEEKNCYRIKADLPGLERSDFEIILDENVLTICGEKKQSPITEKNHFRHLERSYGTFHRRFNLPDNLNSVAVEAFYKDGVLDIIIPKTRHSPVNALIVDAE
jgi:HSP20 family molecular chaperone IbpA